MTDQTFDSPEESSRRRAQEARAHYAPAEPRALGALALLAAAAILWVIAPVGAGVLMGTLLAFATYRPYRQLLRRTHNAMLSAVLVTGAATALVAGTLGVLGTLLILHGVAVTAGLPRVLGPGGPLMTSLAQFDHGPLASLKLQPSHMLDRLRDAIGSLGSTLAGWAAQAVGIFFDGLMALFFMAFTMGVVLLHWGEVTRRAERLLPFNPRHTRHLMRELRRIGRSVVIGNFGTGVIQGAIAGLGYWIAHLPQPAFWGAITALASLVPALGTLLIWIPAGIFLLATGHTGGGIFELAWGSVMVVLLCDYVLRPRLVGGGEAMSTWMTFVSIFGGIKLFGVVGLLLGPLIAGVSMTSLRVYERARRYRLRLG